MARIGKRPLASAPFETYLADFAGSPPVSAAAS
jgi:hypothetical protein